MKKLLLIILTVITVICLSLSVSACVKQSEDTHKHTYSKQWSNDDAYHWHEPDCGHNAEVRGKAEHDFKNGICSVCSYKKQELPPSHTHSFGKWLKDGEEHWRECTCGEKSQQAAHSFNRNTCTVCGYEKPASHTHSWGSWEKDAAKHWKECACGEKSQQAAHSFNGNTCTVCGYQKPASHTHSWGNWQSDSAKHWKECACGEKSQQAAHSFNGNTCTVCGYSKPQQTIEVTQIVLNKTNLTLNIEEVAHLTATVIPANATDKTLSWQSSDSSVASVKDGKITALNYGVTTVTVSSVNGKTAECAVTVSENTNGLVFEKYKGGFAVVGYTGTEIDLVIPSSFNGKQVIAIGTGNTDGLTNNLNLRSATLSENIIEINASAFEYCTALQSVTIPNCIIIGDNAFKGCVSLNSVDLPVSCVTLGNGIFASCNSLQSVTLPFMQNSLSDYFGVTDGHLIPASLKSVAIAGGSAIPKNAFLQCANITEIIIADTITSIGENSMCGCANLQRLTVPFIGSSRTASENSDSVIGYFFGNYAYTGSVQIKQNKTVFHIPKSLESVTVTDGEIHSYAFSNCYMIKSISLNSKTTSVGSWAFYNCNALNTVYYSGTIADWCSISFGHSGACPLRYAKNFYIDNVLVTEIIIPYGVTEISSYAFIGLETLTAVNIPESVTIIGDGAFSGCSNLESLYIPYGVKNLGDSAFSRCVKLSSVIVPDSVTIIGERAFYSCSGLINVEIGNGVTEIGSQALMLCNNLKNLKVPFIGSKKDGSDIQKFYHFFGGYNSLADVYPDALDCLTVTGGKISGGAFREYDKITKIIVEESATVETFAFSGCNNLEELTVPRMDKRIVEVFNGITTGIPASVKKITVNGGNLAVAAFAGCEFIESIILNNVTSIGTDAFYECKNLINVSLCESLEIIEDRAFYGCEKLTNIDLPYGLKTFGSEVFRASNLKNLIMPGSLTSIDYNMFSYIIGFEAVYFEGTKSVWDNIYNATYYEEKYVYFYSESKPDFNSEYKNYWHYDKDGVTPVIWEKD